MTRNKFDRDEDAESTADLELSDDADFLNVDNLLENVVGPKGWWQWIVTLFLMLTTPSPATFAVYANSVSSHRCRMEADIEKYISDNNIPFETVANRIGPWPGATASPTNWTDKNLYGCRRYQLDWSQIQLDQLFADPPSYPETLNAVETCSLGYVYDSNVNHYPGNVIKEFNTICDRSHFVAFGTSIYMVGMLFGFLLGGWCGDRFGRRITLTVFTAVELGATIGVSLSRNFGMYVFFRALIGLGNTVKVSVGNVLVFEITVAHYRSTFGAVLAVGIDFMFRAYMALCAYLIPDWRALNAAVMCTGALGLFYPLVLPESPRWLISRHRLRKAVDQLHKGCKINQRRKHVEQEELFDCLREKARMEEEKIIDTERKKPKRRCKCKRLNHGLWLKLFSSRDIIVLTVLCSFVTCGITMCFFGLLLYAGILVGSIYLHGFLSSLTGIPAALCSAIIYRRVRSRNKPLTIVLSIAGVFLITSLLNGYVRTHPSDLILTITSNIGLLLVNTAVCMIYVYVAELYPSNIRTYGFGVVFAVSRIGAILSPFVNELDTELAHGTPMIVYSAILMLSILALNQLRDTHGENLANFVEQEVKTEDSEQTDTQTESVESFVENRHRSTIEKCSKIANVP